MHKKVLICGFMGCGKSTLLSDLEQPGLRCLDLDDYIFEQYAAEYKDLGSFIRKVGWQEFRRVESLALKSLVADGSGDLLLALGGGTLDSADNERYIEQSEANLLWLDVDFDVCMNRIAGDHNRPLLSEKSLEELKDLYLKRREVYKRANKKLNEGEISKIKSFAELFD